MIINFNIIQGNVHAGFIQAILGLRLEKSGITYVFTFLYPTFRERTELCIISLMILNSCFIEAVSELVALFIVSPIFSKRQCCIIFDHLILILVVFMFGLLM